VLIAPLLFLCNGNLDGHAMYAIIVRFLRVVTPGVLDRNPTQTIAEDDTDVVFPNRDVIKPGF